MAKGRKVEWVVVGDPHIDKLENLWPTEHLQLQMAELRKGFRYAIKHGIPNLMIPGDIAHKERMSDEGQIALQDLLFEFDGKLNIHILLGNHDVEREGFHSLQVFGNLFKHKVFKTVHIHTKPLQVVMEGVPFNMLPFPAKDPLPHKGIDRSINFAHLERPGALRDNGTKIQKDHGVKQRDKNVWVIGHLHTPQSLGDSHFVGTMYQTNFGESLPKSFIHLSCRNDKGKLWYKIERIPNDPKFKMINLRVEHRKDLKQIEDNPFYLYKLFIKKGTKIDKEDIARFKNLYKAPSIYDNENQLNQLQTVEEQQIVHHSLSYGLGDALKERGANKWQRKRGIQIIENLIEKMKKRAA